MHKACDGSMELTIMIHNLISIHAFKKGNKLPNSKISRLLETFFMHNFGKNKNQQHPYWTGYHVPDCQLAKGDQYQLFKNKNGNVHVEQFAKSKGS